MNSIILVVEDDDDLRSSIEGVLADRSYTVYTASDGQDALRLLQEADPKPNLIVSDIMMPVMDGYEFFEAVHTLPDFRIIPFIFLTARGTKGDVQLARRMGVDDYLIKPFEPDDFILAVENKLRRAQEMRDQAAVELDDARRTMVQLLSHELRTPITYVSGGYQLLAEDLGSRPMAPETEMSLGLIASGTDRLTRLAEQMIVYSQLVAGHVRVQIENAGAPANLKTVVQNALEQLKPLVEARSVYPQVTLDDRQLYTYGVAELLTAGVSEVIRNALSYSPEGSTIRVDVSGDADWGVIRVADHGSGIMPEDVAQIWKVLIQSDRQHREQQGAGMGLPIARRVMESHQGTIDLQTELGVGTVVTMRLPLY